MKLVSVCCVCVCGTCGERDESKILRLNNYIRQQEATSKRKETSPLQTKSKVRGKQRAKWSVSRTSSASSGRAMMIRPLVGLSSSNGESAPAPTMEYLTAVRAKMSVSLYHCICACD